jgi:hypothetical protein
MEHAPAGGPSPREDAPGLAYLRQAEGPPNSPGSREAIGITASHADARAAVEREYRDHAAHWGVIDYLTADPDGTWTRPGSGENAEIDDAGHITWSTFDDW